MAEPAKIMVIDDEEDLLENYRRVLNRFGYEVITFNDSVKAVEMIGVTRPDLVLTDLKMPARDGAFRKDLYYRINVISIFLPPLRERVEDIPVLANHFLQRLRGKDRKEVRGIADEAFGAIMAYPWPGNVRELQNVIERAHALTESEMIQLKDLPEHIACPDGSGIRQPALEGPFNATRRFWNSEFEREYLNASLARHGGNIFQLAREAGIDRKTVYRLLLKHGIQGRRET